MFKKIFHTISIIFLIVYEIRTFPDLLKWNVERPPTFFDYLHLLIIIYYIFLIVIRYMRNRSERIYIKSINNEVIDN